MAALSAQDERPLSKHSISIRPLSAEETDERSAALSEVLIDCEGSAPVSFMASLDHGRAEAFWWGVARGERTLLIAEDRAGSAVVGTGAGGARPVGEPAAPGRRVKMLVHRRARRRSVGTAPTRAAEDAARAIGRTLLVLDTATSDAERLYERAGWTRVEMAPATP
jgi:GNAT superfamily N-acetyltransferase